MVPPDLCHLHPKQAHSHLHEVLHLYEALLVPAEEKNIGEKETKKLGHMRLTLTLALPINKQTLNIVSTTE